jgi:hypothetical protein
VTLYVKVGEWYWGAKCPKCGEMTAHAHDPMRGLKKSKIDGYIRDVRRIGNMGLRHALQ